MTGPALITAMATLPVRDACYIRDALVASARGWVTTDWRSFHLGRWQAVREVGSMPVLECPPK